MHDLRRSLLLLVLLVGTPNLGADVLVVPDDHPRLALAILAADAGDEIVVRTSTPQDPTALGPIVIDKALTILGDPVCNIEPGGLGLQFAGPGSGEVTFVNTNIYHDFFGNPQPLVVGGGFEAIQFVDCTVQALQRASWGNLQYAPIDLVDVGRLNVFGSTIQAGLGDRELGYFCYAPSAPEQEPGIQAPDSTVLLVDSTVYGGSFSPIQLVEVSTQDCPADLNSWSGRGGDGVVAKDVYSWNSVVVPGTGLTWMSYDDGGSPGCQSGAGTPVTCGKLPDGQAYVTTGVLEVNGCSRLTQTARVVKLGTSWSIAWDAGDPTCRPSLANCQGTCVGLLYLALAPPAQPTPFPGGWAHLDPATALFLTGFSGAVSSALSLPVPPNLVLSGLPISAQVMLDSGEPSGPVFAVLIP